MKAENGSQPPWAPMRSRRRCGEFGGTLALAGVERRRPAGVSTSASAARDIVAAPHPARPDTHGRARDSAHRQGRSRHRRRAPRRGRHRGCLPRRGRAACRPLPPLAGGCRGARRAPRSRATRLGASLSRRPRRRRGLRTACRTPSCAPSGASTCWSTTLRASTRRRSAASRPTSSTTSSARTCARRCSSPRPPRRSSRSARASSSTSPTSMACARSAGTRCTAPPRRDS